MINKNKINNINKRCDQTITEKKKIEISTAEESAVFILFVYDKRRIFYSLLCGESRESPIGTKGKKIVGAALNVKRCVVKLKDCETVSRWSKCRELGQSSASGSLIVESWDTCTRTQSLVVSSRTVYVSTVTPYSSFLVVLVPYDALLTGSSLTRSPTRTTTTTTTYKSLKWLGLVERISYTQLTENRVRTVCTEWTKNHFLLKRIGNFKINKISLSLHLDVVLKRNFFFWSTLYFEEINSQERNIWLRLKKYFDHFNFCYCNFIFTSISRSNYYIIWSKF